MGGFNSGGFSPSPSVVTDLEVDSGTVSVDATNDKVGIGTTSPKTKLTVEGTLTIKEQANADSDSAAYGQLWVKSDAPNNLYFTDDTGQDVQITSDGSLAGVAGSLSGLGSNDNRLMRTNGTGGQTAQGSGITVDDSNNVSGLGTLGVGAITSTGALKIGSAAGSGLDAYLYTAGTAAHVGIQWDADGETEGILIGGADNHGVDFKFFGESSGKYVHWDMSGDELLLASSTKLSFNDASGGEYIHASADNVLELFAGTDIKLNTDTVTMASANANDPVVIIKNTTNDANGARLRFVKDKGAAGANNDVAGMIEFYADDANQDQVLFGRIATQISVATDGQEGGLLALQVASHDGEINNGLVITDGSAEDEVDVTIGNGSSSIVTIPGDIDLAGDIDVDGTTNLDAVDIDGNVQLDGTLTVGVDDTGYDVKLFGASASHFLLWDESADELVLAADSKLSFHDAAGGENIVAISDGHLEVNAGATLDMTAPTVDVNASTAVTIDTPGVTITDTTATSATEGGYLRLAADDGAVMADNHRLGVIEFAGAEDANSTISIGARIQAIARDAWDASNNDADLQFYTTDGTTESLVLTLDADKLATFAGATQFNGNATFGVDDTGVDVRFFSATTNEGVLYDASQDELALLLTTKLKFHDVGGGEEIFASADGTLDINAGTLLDVTSPTIDLNASTAVTVDGPAVTIADSADGKPVLTLKTTHTTKTSSSELQFLKDAADTEDGEVLGQITFYGEDEGNNNTQFVGITAEIAESDDGAEGGKIALRIATHDGEMQSGLTIQDGDAEDEVDVWLGNTTTSLTTVAGDLKTQGDTVTFESANSLDPLVIIKNTTNDTNGARLQFVKDKGAAGADNDIIGSILFYGDDDAQDNIEFASIVGQVADASNGSEGGRLILRVASHDGEINNGIVVSDGSEEDEVDVTIGNGAQSLTTISGDLTVTSDANFKDVINHGDPAAPGRVVLYEEVDVRHANATDNTVSVQFGQKIPQDSVVTRVVAIVKTASNLGTHNVQIRFDVGDGRAADYNATSTSQEALGAGAANTRSSTNVGSAVDIDLTAAKESYINDTPSFMTTADVYPYVCNAGTSNGGTDATSGTLLIYIEYYGLD